jgi:predicted O-linked N-acetylglucosamine transferase (SPINDLY family)
MARIGLFLVRAAGSFESSRWLSVTGLVARADHEQSSLAAIGQARCPKRQKVRRCAKRSKSDAMKLTMTMTPEFQLLLACARVLPSKEDEIAIRQILDEPIDWTQFVRKALDHGLVELTGQTLARAAPDRVPADILAAFREILHQTRKKNSGLLAELARLIGALEKAGIAAIPFKGPVLALQAYGHIGLRVFGDFDFLVHDADMARAVGILLGLGYERPQAWSDTQIEIIQRLQGQEFLLNRNLRIGVEPHTRLTPIKMALDIDYAGLWRRAQRTDLGGGVAMLSLAPEDCFLMLAIHGGKELWWNIKWACDVGAFLASHPKLDWAAIVERAQAQGCLRMMLLAASLARRYFGAAVPETVFAAQRPASDIERMVRRIVANWQSEKPLGAPSHKSLSMDRLRLHDGIARRARYVARTLLLPSPHHVAGISLPKNLSFAYVPIKLGHDVIALPLWRTYNRILAHAIRLGNAIKTSDLALAIMPASTETRLNIKRFRNARASAERALAADPTNALMLVRLAHALAGLKRYPQAIACFDKALVLEPDNAAIWRKRVDTMVAMGKKAKMPDFAAIPQDADGWNVQAGGHSFLKRYAEAVEASDRALALAPGNINAMRLGIQARLHSCDWRRREDDKRQVAENLRADVQTIAPLFHCALSNSEAENLLGAKLAAKRFPQTEVPLWRGELYHHDKIRIAYLSTDLREHVVADAITGVFERHDKAHFETTAISLGPDDGSEQRRRIQAAFDRFIDARAMSDEQISGMIRSLEIDIVIDLNGYSGVKRTGIFAVRPAPIQVNYLGYPGTLGASFMDYVIADRITIPEEARSCYAERIAYLPHSYMPNDEKRTVSAEIPNRSEAGLPETGFVFACFNASHKIGPEIFDVWMRLLRKVEGSVLWLRHTNDAAIANLRREARARGVEAERLVFAPRMPRIADHLARLRLGDLFVDTLTYNAHATACDALWAGLPVLTCAGSTFPGRVAASILHAVGLPELVTYSLADYEELALALAREPDRLGAVRAKLLRNRDSEPLFDTTRFTRDLEAAYTSMWKRQQAGLPPANFAVSG